MTREFSRQAFVRGALGLTAAGVLLGSCREPATPDAATPSPQAGPQDWRALDDALDGHVVMPSNPDFPTAKGLFNTRFADSTPAAVVSVQSTGDVQKAVGFAAEHDVKITVRSGGHSYIGASAANGALVIDLRQFPGEIVVDEVSGHATISAAAVLSSVQPALNTHGRSIPAGSCPSVGVPGLTLGGGLGADARQSGLTCDSLVSASVVLPSGEAVTASGDDHPELFWALRGGGANVGIVTSFTYQTFPTVDRDVVSLTFPEEVTAQVIAGWHGWLSAADRAIWSMVNVTCGPDTWRCGIVLATPPGDGARIAGDLSAAIGLQPVGNTASTLDHLDFVSYFSGGVDATRPRAFIAGSDIIETMTAAAAESIVAATSAWSRAIGSATAVIESLDGAVSDIASGDTAFPWRRHAACVQWYVETPSPAAVTAGDDWLAAAHQAVAAHSVGGYVNYVEPAMPAARYFGGNLPQLTAVRQRYDPTAVMYSNLGF
jgi:FAD/FMN-containing dehydrogenase